MYQFHFTSEVLCFDGVVKRFKHKKYVASRKIFLELLAMWDGCNGPNGGKYSYWESPVDYALNMAATVLPENYNYELFSMLFYSSLPSSYANEFVYSRDHNGNPLTKGYAA